MGATTKEADRRRVRDLVLANRILYRLGVVDAFGHVSVRHDKSAGHFLLARNLAPARVEEADIVAFDLDGTPLDADGRAVYLERFIHAELYRARPDVQAVVHSHAYTVIPFGAVAGERLRPVWHMAAFLGEGVPVFEIRETAGDASDLLITDSRLGAALARTLGTATVVLMRGHGATVVGDGLPQAVFRAVHTQVNAQIQLAAQGLGAVTFLTAAEAHAASASVGGQVARAWDLWRQEAAAPPAGSAG